MTPLFKNHGIGVGLRPAHYAQFKGRKPASVDWVEVISENFLDWAGLKSFKPHYNLELIRREVPVALHGVSMSIGSVDPLNLDYLKSLKELKDRFEPMWVSDHLCWTGVNQENFHDLLPIPFTQESLEHVVERVHRVQDILQTRILVENVSSYLDFEHSEMSEWEFLHELSKRAECGLLLDVNNIFVSATNHGFDAKTFIDQIPATMVGQIHLAGHVEQNGILIDTHDQLVRQEVWDLYGYALKHVGQVSTMIERDDNIPVWEELELELKHARKIYDEAQPDPIAK